MPVRLGVLAAIFLVEKLLLHFAIDTEGMQAAAGVGAFLRGFQSRAFQVVVSGGACLALLSHVRFRRSGMRVFDDAVPAHIRPQWFLVHLLLVLPLAPLAFFLSRNTGDEPLTAILTPLCAGLIVAAVWAAFEAMSPWSVWHNAAHRLGVLWLYAGLVAGLAAASSIWLQMLWRPTAGVTFELVRFLLLPLLPTLAADPAARILGTDRFRVEIADSCSGLEGLGLMLVFCGAFLVLLREEYRFPQALFLVPIGSMMVFVLNAIRIAVLVLLGHAGFTDIADYGFHTQAGWIGFTCAAGAVVLLSRRSRWISLGAGASGRGGEVLLHTPTATYLMPFLVVLAAGMLSLAASGRFDWLDPLRLVAGSAALVWVRTRLVGLDWRISWRGPLAGMLAFIVWVSIGRITLAPRTIPVPLSTSLPLWRDGWVTSRVLASVLIVPITEELAFRGYLLRRLRGARFELVPFSAARGTALVLSSVIFGISHGVMWAPAIVAGWLYGWLVCSTGRIGESVAAHATTNALVAGVVLIGGQWQYW